MLQSRLTMSAAGAAIDHVTTWHVRGSDVLETSNLRMNREQIYPAGSGTVLLQ
jgi:hypothetical protein